MITKVHIKNFKSIEDLSLSLGRVNVLIGENGCGKTNILEGIAMAAAAEDAKNLNEHLGNRGVRVTPSAFMRSGFEEEKQNENVTILLRILSDLNYNFEFLHSNEPYSFWSTVNKSRAKSLKELRKDSAAIGELLDMAEEKLKVADNKELINDIQILFNEIKVKDIALGKGIEYYDKYLFLIMNFVIYAPENHFLRKTDEIGTVKPLGYRGEGLIKLVSVLHKEKPEAIEEIKKHLRLISWFEDFEIVNDAFTGSYVKIRDAYLGKDIYYPNLKSTNEGFLFLLFYLTLFIAEYTPKFFAIDNIDNALNPKLCRELVKVLAQLAKKHDKQVIFTTHNPAVLDGLNLDDDEQRLFVVYRNAEGRTKTRRVKKRETPEGYEPMKMSEQYMNGFIGGLPKNF